MSVGSLSPPVADETPPLPVYRFTVEEYHRIAEHGVLTSERQVELVEGWIVYKLRISPPQATAVELAHEAFRNALPDCWRVRSRSSITTTDSEPRPDLAVVRGDLRAYRSRHPSPADTGMVVEIADSSLARDRGLKSRLYARAELPTYWIVNLIDRQVEVYTDPTGPCDEPKYATSTNYAAGSEVPVVLDGVEVARLKVDDLLP